MFLEAARAHVNSGEASVLLLSGNVRDVYLANGQFRALSDMLRTELFKDYDSVAEYDPQGGIQFADAKQREAYFRSLGGYDAYHKTTFAQNPPKDPVPAFSILDNLARLRAMQVADVEAKQQILLQEAQIRAVTLEQVNAAWARHIRRERFVVSTAGDF